MFLFSITRPAENLRRFFAVTCYYSGAIVLAPNAEEATCIHPDKTSRWVNDKWVPTVPPHSEDPMYECWDIGHLPDDHDYHIEGPGAACVPIHLNNKDRPEYNPNNTWVSPKDVKVQLIGTPSGELGDKPRVIFNRGSFA